jgi:hypothetical protein
VLRSVTASERSQQGATEKSAGFQTVLSSKMEMGKATLLAKGQTNVRGYQPAVHIFHGRLNVRLKPILISSLKDRVLFQEIQSKNH